MSVENIKSFFKKLEDDENFRNEFLKNGKIEKDKPETILMAASEAGYPFTMEELETAKKEEKELSPEELEKIAGGIGVAICFNLGVGAFDYKQHQDTQSDYLYNRNAVCFILGLNYG